MAQSRSQRTHAHSPARHRPTWVVVGVLLAAALVATLWVPFYNRTTPAIGGFPFFYWYQLVWVPAVAVLSALAYLLSKRTRIRGDDAAAPGTSPGAGSGTEGAI